MYCRSCNRKLDIDFVDLGNAPPSNAYLNKKDISSVEEYYPLKVCVCKNCWLVQTIDYIKPENLFTNQYAYLSSSSKSWLSHSQKFAEQSISELQLDNKSLVIEVASNDGYLLQYFKQNNIPCIGIEPTKSTRDRAISNGLHVIDGFCTLELSKKVTNNYGNADLVIANNVYAHVPDINDFTLSLKQLLKKDGTISIEFPHLINLIRFNQFDTIYHEHYSYLSLTAVNNIFLLNGLRIWKVQKLNTHGGSLRVYGCHTESKHNVDSSVKDILREEIDFGIKIDTTYTNFNNKAIDIKNKLLTLLIQLKNENKIVMAYGAAAKGNTLINYAGIRSDLIRCVFDKADLKQGLFLPGSHIPILNPDLLSLKVPDYLLILPWNISDEIIKQLNDYRKKGMKFITVIPSIRVFE